MRVGLKALLAPATQSADGNRPPRDAALPRARPQSGVQCKVSNAALEAGSRPLRLDVADEQGPAAMGAPTLPPAFDVDLYAREADSAALELLHAVDGRTPLEVLLTRTALPLKDGISLVERLLADKILVIDNDSHQRGNNLQTLSSKGRGRQG